MKKNIICVFLIIILIVSLIILVTFFFKTKTRLSTDVSVINKDFPSFSAFNVFTKNVTILKIESIHTTEFWIIGLLKKEKLKLLVNSVHPNINTWQISEKGFFDIPSRFPEYIKREDYKKYFDYSIKREIIKGVIPKDNMQYVLLFDNECRGVMNIK